MLTTPVPSESVSLYFEIVLAYFHIVIELGFLLVVGYGGTQETGEARVQEECFLPGCLSGIW